MKYLSRTLVVGSLLTFLLHFFSCSLAVAQTDPGRIVTGTVFPGLAGSEANYIKAPQPFSPADLKPEVNYDTSIDATVDRDTDSGDLYNGKPSWNCTFDALNDWCEFYTTPIPLDGQTGNCEASVWYKSATSNTLEVRSSSDLIASQSLPSASTWTKASLVTSCGSSRKIRLVGGSGGSINHVVSWSKDLGQIEVSQAQFVGTLTYAAAANCIWSTQVTSYDNFSADADCPTAVTTGKVSAPGTKIPGVVVNDGPGIYVFEASAATVRAGSHDSAAFFRLSDGTNNGPGNISYVGTTTAVDVNQPYSLVVESQGGSITVQFQGMVADASNAAQVNNHLTGMSLQIRVRKYPLYSELASKNTLDVLGTPVFSPTDTCPAGSIAADGSAFPTGPQYAQLKAKLGNPANLPDWRGLAPAFSGSQTLSGVVHDGGSPGDKQNDQMQGHRHTIGFLNRSGGSSARVSAVSDSTNFTGNFASTGSDMEAHTVITDDTNGTPRVGTTTRMANVRFKPCISYANTPAPFIPNMVTSSADKPVHDWISFTCSASSSVANGSTNDWLTVGNATDTGNTRTCAVTFAQAYTERPGCQITSIVGSDTSLINFDVAIFNFTASGFTMVGPDFDYYGVISCTGKR